MSQDMLFDHTLNCVLLPVAWYTYGKCDNGDVYLKRIYFHNYCCGVCGKSGVYYDRISETQGHICRECSTSEENIWIDEKDCSGAQLDCAESKYKKPNGQLAHKCCGLPLRKFSLLNTRIPEGRFHAVRKPTDDDDEYDEDVY